MTRKQTRSGAQGRILKVGETYLDRSRGVLVTMEDHEIVGGRRTGRVVQAGTQQRSGLQQAMQRRALTQGKGELKAAGPLRVTGHLYTGQRIDDFSGDG